MAIVIREAGMADASLIARMSRETFTDTFAEHNSEEDMSKFLDEVFTMEALEAEVGMPGNYFYLAEEEDGKPLGYLRMREPQELPENVAAGEALEIARIYAVKEAIGKGVGSKLMETAISIARQQERKMIWLGVWEKNERAIAFYERWGFSRFSKHLFMLGNDPQTDWLMMKRI